MVYIHPSHRGENVTPALIRIMEAVAEKTGIDQIEIHERDKKNLSLFGRLGYKACPYGCTKHLRTRHLQ